MKNLLFFWIVTFIILSSFCLADSSDFKTLGIVKKNQCIQILQQCDNCTYVNFTSILLPDKNTLWIYDVSMEKHGIYYNYSFCNNTQIGTYIVNTFGDLDGIITGGHLTYDVTPDGTNPSTSQGLMYSFILIIFCVFFLVSIVGAYKLEGNNQFDMGGLIKVNFNKYFKIGLFFLSYLFLIFIVFTAWQISLNFLFLNVASKIFETIFYIIMYLLAPVFIVFFLIAMIKIFLDVKLYNLAKRGLKPYSGDKW